VNDTELDALATRYERLLKRRPPDLARQLMELGTGLDRDDNERLRAELVRRSLLRDE
jgi:hypothetical protein